MASSDLTLGELLARAVSRSQQIHSSTAPSSSASTQSLIQSALSDLTLVSALVDHLAIFSPNETLRDINTKQLTCLLVDALRGQLELLVATTSPQDRLQWVNRAKVNFTNYVELVDRYEIVPVERRSVMAGPRHTTQDPSQRRQSKIAQYKMAQQLQSQLQELRERRVARRPRIASSTPLDDLDYESSDDDDDIDLDVSRPLLINQLLLHYVTAHTELASIELELEMLQHGLALSPPESHPASTSGERRRENEDETSWRVEKLDGAGDGPLLDPQGKVLRPFTILPSKTSHLSTRLRLQSEVFRSSHRLPTMSIDEFLELEEARGNIIQGGGPASSAAVDQAREDERGDKEADTKGGYEREERGLDKIRDWDEYRDTHRKGEGNMHNRG